MRFCLTIILNVEVNFIYINIENILKTYVSYNCEIVVIFDENFVLTYLKNDKIENSPNFLQVL